MWRKYYEQLKRTPSSYLLIISNLIPLFGFIYWDWNFVTLILLYWLEIWVIVLFTIIKLLYFFLRKDQISQNGQVKANKVIINLVLVFFMAAFLVALLVPFTFLFFMIHSTYQSGITGVEIDTFSDLFNSLKFMICPLTGFVISHLFSFIQNYVINQEYKKISIRKLYTKKIVRVIMFQILFLISIEITGLTKTGGAGLFIFAFVILKTLYDIIAHLDEHVGKSVFLQYLKKFLNLDKSNKSSELKV